MSIKLRNARVIAEPIGRAYELLMGVRPQSVALGAGLRAAWIAREAADIIDTARVKGAEAPHPLHTAWIKLHDRGREVRRTRMRDPEVDFEFELWLFPDGERTLLMVHTEQRAMLEWFDALPFVNDHSYWDDTDPQEGVSKAEWRRRKRDWERVLPIGSAPSDRCLTMVMFNDDNQLPPETGDVLERIPPVEDRLANQARRMHLDEAYAALLASKRETDPDYRPSGFSDLFEAHRRADADPARRQEIRDAIAPHVRAITDDDLIGPR